VSALSDVYLTPTQAAELLHRSVKSLYRMLEKDPTLPRTKLPGGGLLFPRVALERWLHDRTEGMRGPLRLAVVTPTSEAAQRTNASGALKGGPSA
jgi:excisionase family DNA binding protein